METFELWPGGPVLDCCGAEPVSTDSVLLADFARIAGVRRAADFGCGSGLLAILIAQRSESITIDCVELSAEAARCAQRNIDRNGLSKRLSVLLRDLRTLREAEVGKYQLIISNPPYFAVGRGTPPKEDRAAAREERTCSLTELSNSAARLLGDGGRFSMVYPAERLSEALCVLSASGLEPKRLRLVQARIDTSPSVALIEAVRRAKPSLRIEPVLIIKNPDGTDTPEIKRIYHLN
ncbi:MAG: tRNA1(Val) (adenine(37)-N6)-methyltransferase [Oscillospiraceae bacterium]